MNLYTYIVVADTMRRHTLSAQPGAPMTPERPPRPGPAVTGARRLAAQTLRRLADRVEPCPQPATMP